MGNNMMSMKEMKAKLKGYQVGVKKSNVRNLGSKYLVTTTITTIRNLTKM